jgi:hypothetical protein
MFTVLSNRLAGEGSCAVQASIPTTPAEDENLDSRKGEIRVMLKISIWGS